MTSYPKLEDTLFKFEGSDGSDGDRHKYADFRSKLFEMVDTQGLKDKTTAQVAAYLEAIEEEQPAVIDAGDQYTEKQLVRAATIKQFISKNLGTGTAYKLMKGAETLPDAIARLDHSYNKQDNPTKGAHLRDLFTMKQKPNMPDAEHLQGVGNFVDERIKSVSLEDLKIGAALVTSSRSSLRALMAVDPLTFEGMAKAAQMSDTLKRGRAGKEDDEHASGNRATSTDSEDEKSPKRKKHKKNKKSGAGGDASGLTASSIAKIAQSAAKQAVANYANKQAQKPGSGPSNKTGDREWEERYCAICKTTTHNTDVCNFNKKNDKKGGKGNKGGGGKGGGKPWKKKG